MKKRYNYRAYPTAREQERLARLFGCVRTVYNDALDLYQSAHEAGLQRPSTSVVQSHVVTYAKAHHRPYLADVALGPLIQAVRDVDRAYKNFFASIAGTRKGPRIGAPRRKNKFARQSARFMCGRDAVRLTDLGGGKAVVRIPKVGDVRLAYSRPLPCDPTSVTIVRTKDGVYEVSFVVEVEPVSVEVLHQRSVGVDLGLDCFAALVYSDGTREKIANPRHLRAATRRLKRAQRVLSRRQSPDRRTHTKASQNWRKQKVKVARIHASVRNRRTDFHRKQALALAGNQTVVVENLNIAGLARSGARNAQGRGLRRSIHDAGWSAFLSVCAAKMGDRLILVDPRFTSQTCSVCGVLDGPKPLRVRTWTCDCGARLDRDYNAAVNIMVAAGLAETQNACGADIRLALARAVSVEAGTHWSDKGMTA